MDALNAIVVFGYLGSMIALGVYLARYVRKEEDFNLAGRALNQWVVAGSIMATNVAAIYLVGRAGAAVSTGLDILDLGIVDRIVNRVGDGIKAGGRFLRPLQTGRVQNYLIVAATTVIVLLGWYLVLSVL